MTERADYAPGPASGAEVRKDGEQWTLILVRELRHSPGAIWQALTDPAQLSEWSPFDADGSLATVGSKVKLTTVGAPTPMVSETTVTRADAPRLLEYNWGGFDMRWELEAMRGGTRLTLWTNIDRRFIAMGAAGWSPHRPHRRSRRHEVRRLHGQRHGQLHRPCTRGWDTSALGDLFAAAPARRSLVHRSVYVRAAVLVAPARRRDRRRQSRERSERLATADATRWRGGRRV